MGRPIRPAAVRSVIDVVVCAATGPVLRTVMPFRTISTVTMEPEGTCGIWVNIGFLLLLGGDSSEQDRGGSSVVPTYLPGHPALPDFRLPTNLGFGDPSGLSSSVLPFTSVIGISLRELERLFLLRTEPSLHRRRSG